MSDKYVCTLTPELKKKAREELKEKEDWRSRDVQALRDLILKNKAIKCPMDDGFLLRFLRAKKFDYDRAYKTLENYYTIRAENPEHFKDLKPSNCKECLEAGVTMVLPNKDKHGRRIIYFRPGKWDPSKFTIFEILKVNLMNMETVIQSEETQVNGIIMIGNMENMGWEQAKNLNREYFKLTTSLMQEAFPMRMKKMNIVNEPKIFSHVFSLIKPFLKSKMISRESFPARMKCFNIVNEPSIFGSIFAMIKPFMKEKMSSRESFPMRMKAINLVNEPSVFDYVFALIRPFLKEKLHSRMQLHGPNTANLLKDIGKENLPEELGGTLPSGDQLAKEWRKELESHEKFFEDLLQYKITLDRSIAGGNSNQGTDVDCLTGTYKKLNID